MSSPYLLLDCYLDTQGASEAFLPWFEGRPVDLVRAAHDPLAHGLAATLDRFAGIVVTGSAASVLDGIPWVEQVVDLIGRATVQGVPVLGVCFGHQAIACALAGPQAVRRAPRPEVGWHRIEVLQADPLLGGAGQAFTTFLSHEDEVVAGVVRDSGLQVLARSAQCAVQALRMPSTVTWGVQFHAELPYEDCEQLIHSRARRHPEAGLDPALLLAQRVDSTELARRLFGAFFRAASAPAA